MNSKVALLALTLAALANLSVPGWMIWNAEDTLARGDILRLRTQPVDPVDPFRGRYVALNFETQELPLTEDSEFKPFERLRHAYLFFEKDALGYDIPTHITKKRPATGTTNWIRVSFVRVYGTSVSRNIVEKDGVAPSERTRSIHFRYECDRYYMNEKKAVAAEAAYRSANRVPRGDENAATAAETDPGNYVVVRVKDGIGLPVAVFVHHRPIEEAAAAFLKD